VSVLSTCPPKKSPSIPDGLVEAIRRRTGVTVRFFDSSGEPMPDGAGKERASAGPAGAGPSEPLVRLARSVAEADTERIEVLGDRLVAAWPIRLPGRGALVTVAELDGVGDEGQAMGRRLLAAVAEAVRARFDQADVAHQGESLSAALAQSFEEISLLHNIGEVLRVTRPTPALLEYVCSELCETTGAEAAVAYLPAEDGRQGRVVATGVLPLPKPDLPRLLRHVLESTDASVLINNHCQDDPALARFSPDLAQLAVVPLGLGDGPPGAVALLNHPRREFGSPDAKLIRSSANASAVFIENRRLYDDLHAMMLDLVRALASSVDAKDPYTCGHSERVAILSRELARELGQADEQVEVAYMAGLLHDIGKIGTPEAILCKEGLLQPEERRIIAQHPVVGGRILQDIKHLEAVREAVVHHHERVDGAGYPDGLAGDAIPMLARVVGLADAFDAMTSDRPYRPMMPMAVVLDEIRRNTGTQFDPDVVEAFDRIDTERLMEQFAEHATSR